MWLFLYENVLKNAIWTVKIIVVKYIYQNKIFIHFPVRFVDLTLLK